MSLVSLPLLALLTVIVLSSAARADQSVELAKSHVYAVAEVDQPPEPMLTFKVVYPRDLAAERVTGEVVVECVVDLHGVVRDPVVKSSTRKEFELPALQSVVKWKYKPARKAGKKVNVRCEIPVKFEPPKH